MYLDVLRLHSRFPDLDLKMNELERRLTIFHDLLQVSNLKEVWPFRQGKQRVYILISIFIYIYISTLFIGVSLYTRARVRNLPRWGVN